MIYLLILVNVKDKYPFYFLANAGFFATNECQYIVDCACLFSKRNTASMSRYAKTRVQVLHIAKMKTPTKYCK